MKNLENKHTCSIRMPLELKKQRRKTKLAKKLLLLHSKVCRIKMETLRKKMNGTYIQLFNNGLHKKMGIKISKKNSINFQQFFCLIKNSA